MYNHINKKEVYLLSQCRDINRTYKTYKDCHIYFQQPLMQAAW